MAKLFGGSDEPTVPRSLYDALQDRFDSLLDKYHALRITHAANPATPGRVIPPPPSPESVALRRAEDEIIDRLAGELAGVPGMTPAAARTEAERIRQAGMVDSPPELAGRY